MQILKFINFSLLGLFLVFASKGAEGSSLFGDKKEVVFFFSYHCKACYEATAYLSAWEHTRKDVTVKAIPVFQGEHWLFGARLYFLLKLSSGKHSLSEFEISRAAYAVVNSNKEEPVSRKEYAQLLSGYGLEFDASEFSFWWKKSDRLLLSTIDILEQIREESSGYEDIPFVRVSSGEGVPVYVNWTGSPESFIKSLNSSLE